MLVSELVKILNSVPQDLDVRVETGTSENQWVRDVEVHETGLSGYELYGEVVLRIGE